MTREELRDYVEEQRNLNVIPYYVYSALIDGIDTLEQEPSGDAISRQAALEAFGLSEKTRKYGGDHSGYDTMMKYEIQDILEDLSPVNPQPICEEREKGECPYYADDLISRQAVLNTLDRMDKALDTDRTVESYKELLTECYKDLPPVEQESKAEQFAEWVATYIFDDTLEYNQDAFVELACRKLAKLGIVIRMGDEWELVEPQESEKV